MGEDESDSLKFSHPDDTLLTEFTPEISPVKMTQVRLLGNVACGEPIYSPESADVYVSATSNVNADYALKAQGDSMINAGIKDGSIVFIRKQPTLELGEIGAVRIGDELTLKRVYYYQDKNKLVLQSENPLYEPMVFINDELNDIEIIGKAIAYQVML